jgi:hypothetical protein
MSPTRCLVLTLLLAGAATFLPATAAARQPTVRWCRSTPSRCSRAWALTHTLFSAWHTLVSTGPAPVHIDLVGGQMIDTGMEFAFHLRGDGIALAQAGRLSLAADGSQLDFVGMSVLNTDVLCAALAP